MHCLYTITARACPRLLARVLQLFEQQLLSLQTFYFKRRGEELSIEISVACDADLAERLVAKLYHLQSVESVRLAPGDPTRDVEAWLRQTEV